MTIAEDRAVSNYPEDRVVRRAPRRNNRGWLSWALAILGVLVISGTVYAGYVYLHRGDEDDGPGRVVTSAVKKGDLVITVTEDGNVESANNVELKCKVPGPITILEIVSDGSHVKKGDRLVLLDSSSIEDSILTQEIAVAKAEAAKIGSEKDFSAAKIAVSEYQQGTLRKDVRRAEAEIVVARQNLSTAENQLYYSRSMNRRGYVTGLDVESKEFALEQAKLDLEVAELSKEVLQKFTSAKTVEELISKRDSAEALMNSDLAAFTKESNQLKRLKDQLADCTIDAPQDGMVVYANERSNPFQQQPKVDLGAQVNQFQAIVRLPDLKSMQVKALVHESKVDQLRLGMRAKIKIQDRDFQGEITSISNQPEPTMWFQGNSKEYATLIKIDGEPTELKPGMTAEIEILVSQKKGVLQVPVQCVVERGGKFRSYVKTPSGVTARDLVLGGTNDTVIEIVDGLKEGELVLLNPRADEPDATDKVAEPEVVDVDKQYGQAKPAPAGAATGAAAPGGAAPAGAAAPATGSAAGAAGTAPSTGGAANAQAPGAAGGQPGGTAAGSAPASAGPAAGGAPGAFKWPTFKESDKNGDGKITRDESQRPETFDQVDTNSDGGIDPKEFKAAIDKFKKMMQGGGMPGGAPSGQ